MTRENAADKAVREEAERVAYERFTARIKKSNSIFEVLDGYFDKAWDQLPNELRIYVATEFFPLNWDSLTPQHRRETAISLKRQRVPVSAEELQSAKRLIDCRNDILRQIEKFEGARDSSSLEIESNRSNLERLGAELNEVKEQISKARGDDHLNKQQGSPHTPKKSVKAWEIMDCFIVNDKNESWWSSRMSDAERYGLLDCRDKRGMPGKKNSSTWYPDGIAGWLIDKKHMNNNKAAKLLRTHFPEYAEAADQLDPPME